MLEWRPVINYEDEYLVSNRGDVWSIRSRKCLKAATDKYGYSYFVFSVGGVRKTVKAHRLVAKAFIDNPMGKPTINHKNGIRNDNRVENLEWATLRDQALDERTYAISMERSKSTDYYAMGAKRDFGRKQTAVYTGKQLLGIYHSLKEAATAHNTNYSKASECAHGKRKTSGGVRFCFV